MKRTKLKSPGPFVMSNDPSMRAWGWSVISANGDVVASGAIKTDSLSKKLRIRKGDDNTRRITEMSNELLRVIREHKPVLLLSELPHGSQSSSAAIMLGFATAIIQTIANTLEIPLEWYSEGDAKLSVCGKRSIEKDSMVLLMEKKYPTMPVRGVKWIDQAVADSLAVYHAALEQSSILKFLKG